MKMSRDDLKLVIKKLSFWRVDKRMGDYKLPSTYGCYLNQYLTHLAIENILKPNGLAIAKDGRIVWAIWEEDKIRVFRGDDPLTLEQEEIYVKNLVFEMLTKEA